jgi:intradiol ring-cleaving dioxygenase-like protein
MKRSHGAGHSASPARPAPRTLLTRVGGGPLAEAEADAAAPSCILTPAKTEGPYFVDERLKRSDIRIDPTDGTVQPGHKLTLKFVVVSADDDCAPVSGAQVDVWHANASGLYSDEAQNGTTGHKYLRGYQVTGDDGAATFVRSTARRAATAFSGSRCTPTSRSRSAPASPARSTGSRASAHRSRRGRAVWRSRSRTTSAAVPRASR